MAAFYRRSAGNTVAQLPYGTGTADSQKTTQSKAPMNKEIGAFGVLCIKLGY